MARNVWAFGSIVHVQKSILAYYCVRVTRSFFYASQAAIFKLI